MVLLLDIGQFFCQISNSVMCMSEALYFSVESFITLLADGEVNHRGEGFPRKEGIGLLLGEDASWVWVLFCLEGA
jgi:hypothetical protein